MQVPYRPKRCKEKLWWIGNLKILKLKFFGIVGILENSQKFWNSKNFGNLKNVGKFSKNLEFWNLRNLTERILVNWDINEHHQKENLLNCIVLFIADKPLTNQYLTHDLVNHNRQFESSREVKWCICSYSSPCHNRTCANF